MPKAAVHEKSVKHRNEASSAVALRLDALEKLFGNWKECGVPEGVTYPTSMNQLLVWTSPKFGITETLKSKRDISTKAGDHKEAALRVSHLIAKLAPEKLKPKRVGKTQKARRVHAEGARDEYKVLLEGVTEQWQTLRDIVEGKERDLVVVRRHLREVSEERERLREENATLTRELAALSPGLRVVR